mmetsp:Transcript_68937/g.192630  ORF Transcript_68937/g.192630 Transcript_68937/m.192630 type:complete len:201 (-) Transcript_68937:1137-1739(-)
MRCTARSSWRASCGTMRMTAPPTTSAKTTFSATAPTTRTCTRPPRPGRSRRPWTLRCGNACATRTWITSTADVRCVRTTKTTRPAKGTTTRATRPSKTATTATSTGKGGRGVPTAFGYPGWPIRSSTLGRWRRRSSRTGGRPTRPSPDSTAARCSRLPVTSRCLIINQTATRRSPTKERPTEPDGAPEAWAGVASTAAIS